MGESIAEVAAGLEPTERIRLIDGRTDWRMSDWQDHCGDWGCPVCDGAIIPEGRPDALSPDDQALRNHLISQGADHDR